MRNYTDAGHGTVIAAFEQTAGRGQRGNTWEAEPHKNLTFSLLLMPAALTASHQFELSMLVALATADFIRDKLPVHDVVRVKWPNDIYVNDDKICGILIENTIEASAIVKSVVGIGININQTTFRSDAPNPVSLAMLTSRSWPLDTLLQDVVSRILHAVADYDASTEQQALLAEYRATLWHGSGQHRYHEPGGPTFYASVTDVSPSGRLTLSNGKTYAFKEIVQEL